MVRNKVFACRFILIKLLTVTVAKTMPLMSMESIDFDGFFAIIDGSNQFPTTTRKSVLIRPGHENIVAINAVDVKADKDIQFINIEKRNCYFPDDKNMSFHKQYSQANCILECQIDFALSQVINF